MKHGLNAADLSQRFNLPEEVVGEIADLSYAQGVADGRNAGKVSKTTAEVTKGLRGVETYRQAYGKGMTLSAWLETQDPSKPGERVDAYTRQLHSMGIRVNSVPDHGVGASTLEELYNAADGRGATLVPEFYRRAWNLGARYGTKVLQAMRFYASSQPVSEVLEPTFMDNVLRASNLRPSLLDQLVAVETGIDGDTFKAFYLTEGTAASAAAERLVRVSEAAGVPAATLTGGDHAITLKKHGRAIEFPYEVTRRWRLDFVRFQLARMAARAQLDKEEAGVSTLINGDGNSGTAATVYDINGNLSGTANQIDLEPLLRFMSKFEDPAYSPTVALANEDGYVEYMTLNTGSGNMALFLALQSALQAQGRFPESVAFPPMYKRSYIDTIFTTASGKALVMVDGSQALGRVFEVGADLQETARIIERQVDVIVMTETEGWWVVDPRATLVLDWST